MISETTPHTIDTPVVELPQWHINIDTADGVVKIILPTEAETNYSVTWSQLWSQIEQRLMGAKRFWQPLTPVHLVAQDRLLDSRQLQAIAHTLNDIQLQLEQVVTNRRQTAVAAATAGYSVIQPQINTLATDDTPPQPLKPPLYLQTTVRSGMEIRHQGTIIVVGDVNPGAEIIAAGDIIIWGKLKGIAHAGCEGNDQCLIMALHMEPTQLRIADYLARSPERPPHQMTPEIAYITPAGIRIAPATEVKTAPYLKDLGQ